MREVVTDSGAAVVSSHTRLTEFAVVIVVGYTRLSSVSPVASSLTVVTPPYHQLPNIIFS